MAEWNPIAITDRKVDGEPTEDRVAVVFHLSSAPDHQWAGFFESARWQIECRPGSTTKRPRLRGNTISVVVAQASRDSAIRQVRSALEGSNREYQTRIIDAQIAAEAKRQELEDRLNSAG
jgi:hypothetical protein